MGQDEAVREMAVALSKQLAGLQVGNILMIGSSGTGKTTLMRAVEAYLAVGPGARRPLGGGPHPRQRPRRGGGAADGPGRRCSAGSSSGRASSSAPARRSTMLLRRAASGLVFVDEVDKIRSHIGGQPNVAGIRAQEALLTLIENEAVPLTLPAWAGGGKVMVNSSDLLFVCAGAFEGLYDAVFDRVTIGRDRGALQPVTVVEGGKVREKLVFDLRDWLRNEDLFDYGMSPQFLSRFDAVVLLQDLGQDELVQIFLETPESAFHQSRAYFESRGIHLAISPAAVRRIATEAGHQPRLGARALKEVFRRVIRDYEFEPAKFVSEGASADRPAGGGGGAGEGLARRQLRPAPGISRAACAPSRPGG